MPGPAPPRNEPKHMHKLPSLPPPIFHPTPAPKQTATRGRRFALPSSDILLVLLRENAVKADPHPRPAVTPKLRGPWNHSGCIRVTLDVESVLAPLQPVAQETTETICKFHQKSLLDLFTFLLYFFDEQPAEIGLRALPLQDIMTSSPPDISSLSLSSHSSQQRLNDNYDYEGNNNARPQYHFATSPGIHSQSSYNPLSLNQSPLKNKPIRSALPTQWLDNCNNASDSRSLSPNNNSDFSSAGGSPPPMGHLNPAPIVPSTPSQNPEDEIIPTAIVIKNIPFNVKRETLLDIIASLSIPTPYAFNYHLDQQGSFRGLAFANFRQAQDADAVVAALNGFDVQGRKLRVEYKKVLQAGEKERIEREKAIRRMRSMQLEKEQNAVNATNSLYDDYGSALSSAFSPGRSFSSGSPYQQPHVTGKTSADEVDLNDPSTLEIYSRILVFKEDPMRDELAFSRSLSPKQRRVVHLLAQKLGVYHYSIGEGDERYVVVTRFEPQRVRVGGRLVKQSPHGVEVPQDAGMG
ncbi:RNA-binding post-transcriptional regulator cip2 [Termitomyces sp. J132]|nr:RNA-binding post-transcriptional regulator cip2 [Termitomyces sp. J132]